LALFPNALVRILGYMIDIDAPVRDDTPVSEFGLITEAGTLLHPPHRVPKEMANNQLHLTHELTAGIHERFSLGFMLLSARLPSHRLEYAGWRLLPHFYAPDSWRLPLKLGLVSELSFQRTRYEENSRRVEIRPILEKSMGHVQVDFNPIFERALHGPGTSRGWNFEPAIRVGYEASKRFTPSLEYYSSAGPVPGFLPLTEQIHVFFPGADLRFGERVVWSLGVGIGATSAGNRIVYKSRLEVQFGRKISK
jgi:hypothetical protein